MKVFVSGEGPDELGEWYREPQYRSSPPVGGIVEALLRKVAAVDFEVIGVCVWKRIHNYRKYSNGGPIDAETHNVLRLMNAAEEMGADVLVFVRDRDRDDDREEAIKEGLRRALGKFAIQVVGGVAVEEIEAWILALRGERRSERYSEAKKVLEEKHGIADRPAKVAAVEGADLARAPEDAASLHAWLNEAARVFAARPPASSAGTP